MPSFSPRGSGQVYLSGTTFPQPSDKTFAVSLEKWGEGRVGWQMKKLTAQAWMGKVKRSSSWCIHSMVSHREEPKQARK